MSGTSWIGDTVQQVDSFLMRTGVQLLKTLEEKMISHPEVGTTFHAKYVMHYHKERSRMVGGIILFFMILMALPFLGLWQIVTLGVTDVLALLMIFMHYSEDAMRTRSYRAAERATRLL